MKDRKVFAIFMQTSNDFDRCEAIESLIEERIFRLKGEENARFYAVLCDLMNSINNAGCEGRRSEQMARIRAEMDHISDHYEDFLP